MPDTFFVKPTIQVVTTQSVVSQWVNSQPIYSVTEKAKFLSKADPWLVAEAIANQHQIITFEELVPATSTKVKIPNVASNFGVKIVGLYDAIEASGTKFLL